MEILPGLYLYDEAIASDIEQKIVSWLDERPWNGALARRTEHYGYEYGYTKKDAIPLHRSADRFSM